MKWYKNLFLGIFLAILFFLVIFFGYFYLNKNILSEKIHVIFFQINRGDANYIKTPHGKEILIDGGQDLSLLSSLEKYRPFYDRHIDLLIITHPDSDHYYGFLEVIKRFSVDNILLTGAKKEDPLYQEIFLLAEEKNIQLLFVDKNRDFFVDGVVFNILFPFESLLGTEKNGNDGSLVIQMEYKGKKILFTGDIEKEEEEKMILNGVDLKSDILKVPHHGSKSSSSEIFLHAVSPEIAVFTVGLKNTFGHPHQEVVDRYKNFKNEKNIPLKIRNTKEEGDIIFEW